MERTNTLEDTLRGYSEYVCQNLSCHGGNWASKIRSGKLKALYLIVLLGFQSWVFNYIITNLWTFWSGNMVINKLRYGDLRYKHEILILGPLSLRILKEFLIKLATSMSMKISKNGLISIEAH